MAIKSTMFKVKLSVSDMDRGYYQDHALALARHPTETDLRLFLRIAIFALNAHEHLQFTKGLSAVEEPDLWEIDLTGEIKHWIEIGQPTEKRLRQSCSKADRVTIYTHQRGGSAPWFKSVESTVARFEHLRVVHISVSDERLVEQMMERSMDLSCVIQDGQALLTNGTHSLTILLEPLVCKS